MLKRPSSNYYLFDKFKKHGCLAAFSRGKEDLGFTDNPNLEINRKTFLSSLGVNYQDLVCARQVHGNKIFLAGAKDKGRGAVDYTDAVGEFDGIATQDVKIPLAVFTADCLSVFLFDIRNKAAAVLHCGWRPTKDKLAFEAIKLMRNVFNSQSQDIICGFGPAIYACCYDVGEDFKQNFSYGLYEREGKFFLDLVEINRRQLIEAGVSEENIEDSRLCTHCKNEGFFSYRREGNKSGRMMSVIMIE